MGYDGRTDAAILFGGRAAGANMDDTWEFDFNTLQWNGPLFPVTAPPARFDAAMTRSAVGGGSSRCFLFGGHTGSFPLDTAFDDLWIYDGVAADWQELSPVGNPADGRLPLPRYAASFVRMDADHFILHGGMNFGGMPMSDTWEYDAVANQWTDLSDNGNLPPSRGFHAAVDGGPNRPGGMIVVGGQTTGGSILLKAWNFGRSPASWWELLSTGTDPTPRSQGNFEWLAQTTSPPIDRLLLFGGTDGNTFLNQCKVYTIDFSQGTSVWSDLRLPANTPLPPPRGRYASMSWQGPNGARVLVFGGTAGAGQGELGDSWMLMEGGNPNVNGRTQSEGAR
jgi:hypothetical protein